MNYHQLLSSIRDSIKNLRPRQIILAALAFGGFVSLFLLALLGLLEAGALGALPNSEELQKIENPAASEIYSADSVLLGRYFVQERSNVKYAEIPPHVVDALISTEDTRFYQHRGIDARSLGRVLVKGLLFQNESAGGGSTLTQQLAKNLYPRKNYAMFSLLVNKMREMIIARRLERVYTKEDLITLYLNTVPFGDNTFGIGTAAQTFYSLRVNDLTVDQAAVLIGMLKATYYYNPRIFPDQAIKRRNVVINQMEKYDKLTAEAADSLKARPLKLTYNKISHHSGVAPYFREFIRPALLAWCDQYNEEHDEQINLYSGGLKIYTTIDSRLQADAEAAVAKQMAVTQKRFLTHWGSREPWEDNPELMEAAMKNSEHYKSLSEKGLSEEEVIKAMNTPIAMNIFTWEGEQQKTLSPMDSIRHYLKFLNAGVLAIDPTNGAVRVWVGGINHNYFQFDHVKATTKRQVGSTFKPIVYAAALEKGVRACSFITAERTVYNNMEDWSPENSNEEYGLKYSLAGALAYSVNTVSVRVLEKAGIGNTVKLAHKMGVSSSLAAVPSLALGTSDISMMEMVTAYSGFANNGKVTSPSYLTAITTSDGRILKQYKLNTPEQALSKETAQLILHMLRRAVNEGTSAALRSQFNLPNDMAGKTGTTQSNTDGWFIAMTPKLVIGAWVGGDSPVIRFRSTALGQGSRTALPIIGEFFALANQDHSLDSITRARFPALPPTLQRQLSCDLYKTDRNIFRRLSGRKEKKKNFGAEKKGLLKKMFSKKEKN